MGGANSHNTEPVDIRRMMDRFYFKLFIRLFAFVSMPASLRIIRNICVHNTHKGFTNYYHRINYWFD